MEAGPPQDAKAPPGGSAAALAASVGATLSGFTVEVLAEVDSTNTELMRRARGGRDAPTLLVAQVQTAGRGRLGRSWLSLQGDAPVAAGITPLQHALTFSVGLSLNPRDWSGLSLAVGVSVAGSLHPALQIKWPNDLWFDGRKLAGILIETVAVAKRRYVVVGVGINIAVPAAAGLAVAPAGLLELLPQCDAPAALWRIAPALVAAILAFESQGLAPFLDDFKSRDLLRDRAVVLSDGVVGVACGVDAGGGLLVHTSSGMKTITSAEVSVRAAVASAGFPARVVPP